MNSASLILMTTTILLFQYSVGTIPFTFATEEHSQEKTLSSCSFLYTVPHCSPQRNKIVLQQIGQITTKSKVYAFFSLANTMVIYK